MQYEGEESEAIERFDCPCMPLFSPHPCCLLEKVLEDRLSFQYLSPVLDKWLCVYVCLIITEVSTSQRSHAEGGTRYQNRHGSSSDRACGHWGRRRRGLTRESQMCLSGHDKSHEGKARRLWGNWEASLVFGIWGSVAVELTVLSLCLS